MVTAFGERKDEAAYRFSSEGASSRRLPKSERVLSRIEVYAREHARVSVLNELGADTSCDSLNGSVTSRSSEIYDTTTGESGRLGRQFLATRIAWHVRSNCWSQRLPTP